VASHSIYVLKLERVPTGARTHGQIVCSLEFKTINNLNQMKFTTDAGQ